MQQARVYDISNVSLYALDCNRKRSRTLGLNALINAATYTCLLGGLATGMMRILGA